MVLVRVTAMSPMMPNRRRVFGGGVVGIEVALRGAARGGRVALRKRGMSALIIRGSRGHRRAGKPDSSDHSSARAPAPPLKALRSRESSAPAVGIVGPAGKVGIGDVGQKPPRSGRYALIVACEGAVAQSRKFVALNAERIPRADRVRGKRASPLAASASKRCYAWFPSCDFKTQIAPQFRLIRKHARLRSLC
jgi:hypothetical protein